MADIDLTTLTDAELEDLAADVEGEKSARQAMRFSAQQIEEEQERHASRVDEIAARFHAARERGKGVLPWSDPTAPHESYPRGWTVEHGGLHWTSVHPMNYGEPGVDEGWIEGDNLPPRWQQPSGPETAYNSGQMVTHEEDVFESQQDENLVIPTEKAPEWAVRARGREQ